MLTHLLLTGIALLAVIGTVSGAEVTVVTWPTKLAAPPPDLPKAAADALPAFRVALGLLPEPMIVQLALSQPQAMGLSLVAAQKMSPLLTHRYELLAKSPAFASAPSSLPYCFAIERPSTGRATVYLPTERNDQTPVMIFLHGSGGSFLWYQHYLAEIFPSWIIIAPAYGIAPSTIPAAYLLEAFAAAKKRCGHSLRRPVLMGLSAGGFGAAHAFVEKREGFNCLLILAAYPPSDTLPRFLPTDHLHILSGGDEVFVSDGIWARTLRDLQSRRVPVNSHLIPEADHFFLLTHAKESESWLKQSVGR